MTYDWYFLCSDPRRLALTLRYLPKTLTGLGCFNVCYASHLDAPETTAALEMTLRRYVSASIPRYRLVDLSPHLGKLPAGLALYADTGKPRWSLGMKLLFPLIGAGPYLYTDDDVLVTNDPAPLMINGFGSQGCFRFAGSKGHVADQLFDAFELTALEPNERPWQTYDRAALDAGVWFHLHADDWGYRLERFAELDYLKDLTTSNLELRCLDQRFLTCFGLKHGWTKLSIGQGFAPPRDGLRPTFFDKKIFFHYKSSQKQRWMTALERHADETGR